MYALLSQAVLAWPHWPYERRPHTKEHTVRKDGDREGRPFTRYSDGCRQDLREMAMDEDLWEEVAAGHGAWRQAVYDGLATLEEKRAKTETTRRQKRRNKIKHPQ